MVWPDGHAGAGDVQRDRPHPFVGVGLDLLLGLQHGHRPVAEEVVEPPERAGDDPVRLVPGPALGQHGLADPADEERLEQRLVGLVEQQVAMVPAIGGQDFVEDQPQHGLGLIDLAKGVGSRREAASTLGRITAPGRARWARAGDARLGAVAARRRNESSDQPEQGVEIRQEPGVLRPGGEIQVSDDFL